jgi:hypothetical protein
MYVLVVITFDMQGNLGSEQNNKPISNKVELICAAFAYVIFAYVILCFHLTSQNTRKEQDIEVR